MAALSDGQLAMYTTVTKPYRRCSGTESTSEAEASAQFSELSRGPRRSRGQQQHGRQYSSEGKHASQSLSASFGGAFLRSVYVPRPGATLVRPLFRNKAGEQHPAAASKGPTRCTGGKGSRGLIDQPLSADPGPKPNKKRSSMSGVTEARYCRTRQRAGQCAPPVPSAR
ncbi:hypothetical protein MTO96_021399 [Rhipicephalus appendiculatus]